MSRRFVHSWLVVASALLSAVWVAAVSAQWQPSGPISLMIAFKAGGGADTQARLIAAALEERKGWKIIPSNVTGKGGAVLAARMRGQPGDGLTIGITVSETFDYTLLASKKPGYAVEDFTYITTTAGTQMGIYARADSGFESWDDVVEVARSGRAIRFGTMSPKLSDLAYLIGKKDGIRFNAVQLKGGRGVLNAITAGDVDVGFGAGIQNKAVKTGAVVHLLSAEPGRLRVSPHVPTLKEKLGIPFDASTQFLIFGPRGIPEDARQTIAMAIADVLNDGSTKATAFVTRAFGGPQLISGVELERLILDGVARSSGLLEATAD